MIIPAFFACLSGLIFGLRYAATIRANQVVAAPPAPVPAPTPAPRPAPTPVEGGDGESVPLLSPSLPAAPSPPPQWFADDSPICTLTSLKARLTLQGSACSWLAA